MTTAPAPATAARYTCTWCGNPATKRVRVGRDTGPACDDCADDARHNHGATVSALT